MDQREAMQPANSSPPTVRGRPWLSLLVGTVISFAAFWGIAATVNLTETFRALVSVNLLWFSAAFVMQMLATACTVRRWQLLLHPFPTRLYNLAQIYLIAHLMNTLLPAKLGTVARVLLGAESEKLNAGLVVGSVAIEKVLDSLLMLVLLALLAPFVPLPEGVRDSLTASVLIVLVLFTAVAAVRRVREPLLRLVQRVESRIAGHPSERAASFVRGFFDSLVNLTRRRETFGILWWTALVWLAGGAVNTLLFAAVGFKLDWTAAWFLMVVLQIGTRVPALPANLGVFHYLVILALGVYGVNQNTALAYAILLHLIVFILPALIGAVLALPVSARLSTIAVNSLRRTT